VQLGELDAGILPGLDRAGAGRKRRAAGFTLAGRAVVGACRAGKAAQHHRQEQESQHLAPGPS
jgi:hypothetical protein